MGDYVTNFTNEILLCGHCGRRLFPKGSNQELYCEKCGHGNEQAPQRYVKVDKDSCTLCQKIV